MADYCTTYNVSTRDLFLRAAKSGDKNFMNIIEFNTLLNEEIHIGSYTQFDVESAFNIFD